MVARPVRQGRQKSRKIPPYGTVVGDESAVPLASWPRMEWRLQGLIVDGQRISGRASGNSNEEEGGSTVHSHEDSIRSIVQRIMKEDAAGRREPDPQLVGELRRLVRQSQCCSTTCCAPMTPSESTWQPEG
jgi:hypothetical protein